MNTLIKRTVKSSRCTSDVILYKSPEAELNSKYVEVNGNAIHLSLKVCVDLLQTVNLIDVLSDFCIMLPLIAVLFYILNVTNILGLMLLQNYVCVALNVANLPFFK